MKILQNYITLLYSGVWLLIITLLLLYRGFEITEYLFIGALPLIIYGYLSIYKKYKGIVFYLFFNAILISIFAYVKIYSQGYDVSFFTNSGLLEILSTPLVSATYFIDIILNIGYGGGSDSQGIFVRNSRLKEPVSYLMYFLYLSAGAIYSMTGLDTFKKPKPFWFLSYSGNHAYIYVIIAIIFLGLFLGTLSLELIREDIFHYIFMLFTIWGFGFIFLVSLFLLIYHNKIKIFYIVLGICLLNIVAVYLGFINIFTQSIYHVSVIFPLYFTNYLGISVINLFQDFMHPTPYGHEYFRVEYYLYPVIIIVLLIYSIVKNIKK